MPSEFGFGLLANVLDMQVSLPIQLTPTVILDRCAREEVATIQGFLNGEGHAANRRSFYETERSPVGEGGSEPKPVELPQNQWRYYALRYSGDPDKLHLMFKLAYISSSGLECDIAFSAHNTDGKVSVVAGIGFNFNWIGHFVPMPKAKFDEV
jgi:hypothetical protein